MGSAYQDPGPSIANGRKKPVNAPLPGRRSFELSSTMESVSEVEAAADKMAEEAGLDEDERFHVTMAVREAAVNAVLHGNEYDPAQTNWSRTGKHRQILVFTIADQGSGFIPEEVPDPLAPENLLRGTGRGIFLIRSLMDEVHFRQLHPGTELTLVKHLAARTRKPERSVGTRGLDSVPYVTIVGLEARNRSLDFNRTAL